MRYTFVKREFPSGNPIANILVIVAGALIIGVAVVLGFFAFLALGALVLTTAAVIGIRVWWLNRKSGSKSQQAQYTERRESAGVIEGECRVVDEDRDKT